jgi:hypothetical protein
MTAMGFAMFWVGTISALCFHDPHTRKQSTKQWASVVLAVSGVVCILIGVTVWMWGAMP